MSLLELKHWIMEGDAEEVRKCIKRGADVNNTVALVVAFRTGNTEIIKILMENGADVNIKNKYGTTSLTHAAWYGCTGLAKLLLEYGADVDAKDNRGWTALMWASLIGNIEIFKLLLENGADLEAKNDDGETVFMISASQGYDEKGNILEEEMERRKQVKMARYTFLRHTNFHLAPEIALRTN